MRRALKPASTDSSGNWSGLALLIEQLGRQVNGENVWFFEDDRASDNKASGGEMKHRCAITIMCLVLGQLTISEKAFGYSAQEHGKATPAETQMMKMHALMPMFSLASAGLKTALEKSDTAMVELEADKILSAVPDLIKSRPHKNSKQHLKFVQLAKNLEVAVSSTVSLAKNGDLAGAKVAFKKVEGACAACHAKFR